MTKNEMKAIARLAVITTPFYASDYDIPSGTIQGLYYNLHCIAPTGKTKDYFIPISEDWKGETLYKKAKVCEWKVDPIHMAVAIDKAKIELNEYMDVISDFRVMGLM